MMRKTDAIVVVFSFALIVSLFMAPSAVSKKKNQKPDGAVVFNQNCASCHTGGGNSVNPKKPVANSEKLVSFVTFKAYLEHPQGHMPFYKHIITDKQTLQALYEYCKKLKVTAGA